MRINIFEGARRIALLLAVLATVTALIVTGTNKPYLSVSYHVSRPDAPFNRTDEPCPTEAARDYFSKKSPDGNTVSINLCLLTMPFGKDHQQLVPYKIDQSGMLWGATSYSNEVSVYEHDLESRFTFPAADAIWVDQEISGRYWKNWMHSLGFIAVGLGIFWVLVWAIGWIVRGFAGIPLGKDRRPSDA